MLPITLWGLGRWSRVVPPRAEKMDSAPSVSTSPDRCSTSEGTVHTGAHPTAGPPSKVYILYTWSSIGGRRMMGVYATSEAAERSIAERYGSNLDPRHTHVDEVEVRQ